MGMMDDALRYAALGWEVFPCHTPRADMPGVACSCEPGRRRKNPNYQCHSPGKHPRTANGLNDASSDPEQIREWWKQWPDANIGINCGASGLLVVDLDEYKDNYQGHDLEIDAADTVTAITGGGGGHGFYRLEPGDTFGNSSKGLPPGIDIRGIGGYVVVAPSLHKSGSIYQWEHDYSPWEMEPAAIPPKLRALLEAQRIQKVEEVIYDTRPKYNGTGASRYGAAALKAQCEAVSTTGEGGRNEALNAAAFSLGQLVAGGEISLEVATAKLVEAAIGAGLSQFEAQRTTDSGIKAGMLHPRSSQAVENVDDEVDAAFRIMECPDAKALRGGFDLLDYRPEDGGILDLWFDLYGDERMFAVGFDSWFFWCGTHWQKDETLTTTREIERLIDAMNQRARNKLATALEKEDQRLWGRYVNATQRSKSRVASVEGMARSRCAVATGIINTGNTLNLRNGVLDLDTLELRPHSQGDNLTYCLPYDYDPAAHCPRFEQFIREVLIKENTTEPDHELCDLIQESIGYALTNDTKYEAMFWFSGDGGNGKTVAITMLQRLLGPLCFSVSFEEMGRAGNYDLAEVVGKRVIFSTESERGGKLAEGHIKRIVSGERINTRPIYGSPFEFQSTAKIFWAMNDLPVVRDTSNGVWRRLKLFPFLRTFTEKDKDPNLIPKLENELPGILNFALDGLKRLRTRGYFSESTAAIAAVEEYRHESNPVQQWLDERTQPSYTPGSAPFLFPTTAKSAFDDYRSWAEQNGRQAMNSTNFGREMRRLRIPKKSARAGNVYALTLIQ